MIRVRSPIARLFLHLLWWVWRVITLAPAILATMAFLAWAVGRVLTDRYGWSQWLLWIPTSMVIVACAGGLGACAIWLRKRAILLTGCGMLLLLTVHLCMIEHRLHRRPAHDPPGLRVVHWNATMEGGHRDDYIDATIGAHGDITVLTDAGRWPLRQQIIDWNEGRPRLSHPFAVLTKLPIIHWRSLVREDEIIVLMLELDTTEQLGRSIVMYVVDMPSDLNLSRIDLAQRARRMMDNADAPPPDIVVGDFNMTRNAASVRTIFPGMTHAFDQAGAGWSGTFHRGQPPWLQYHIDHILLADWLRATSYTITDPGIGRHSIQAATIVPAQ